MALSKFVLESGCATQLLLHFGMQINLSKLSVAMSKKGVNPSTDSLGPKGDNVNCGIQGSHIVDTLKKFSY